MSRYVLMGLAGKDVDVLTKLSRLSPRPEVLVVHSDPGALILRLADVAQLPALTEPPRPRPDDVLVVPSSPNEEVAVWARAWHEAGAHIVLPEVALRASSAGVRGVHDPAGVRPAPARAASTPLEEKPVSPEPVTTPPADNGSRTAVAAPPAGPKEEQAPMSAGPAPAAAIPAGGSGPAEVWESPEATLRYLAEQALGRGAAVTLWWDGGLGSWVPWVWTGPSPGPRPQEPADALHLRTECGEFRLSGAGERSDQLPVAALTRVAEDMALRDLLRWRREARGLAALGLPDLHGESAALAGWVAPVRRILAATAVLMWRREGPLWRLVHAEGEGLGLEGTFTLPGDLFTATFEGERSPWRRWEPTPGLRAHLRLEGEDPRWPLRLRRVELALTGEEAAW